MCPDLILKNGQKFMINQEKYTIYNQIRFKTSVLRSELYDYSDKYIVAKGTIHVTDPNNNEYDKQLAFKNNGPFISCITKINNS